MIRQVLAVLLCCVVLLLGGCKDTPETYKRINFESEFLSEQLRYLKEDTVVEYQAKETVLSQITTYKVEERSISDDDYQQMLANLGWENKQFYDFKREGNYLNINLASRTDSSRGYFTITEEEGEKLAWEAFRKIPFLTGEYECVGMRDTYRLYEQEDSYIIRAGFVFCRVLDGVRVVGDESCVLHFDGSGLVAVSMKLYDYQNIGTMDLMPLVDARTNLKTPDDFDVGTASSQPLEKYIKTLQVDQVNLRLVNQYSEGCTTLQPIYYFTGTATYEDGYSTNFSSKVIAIPENENATP